MKLFFFAIIALVGATLSAADLSSVKAPGRRETSTNDPIYIAYLKVVAADDAAEKEIDRWVRDAEGFDAVGAGGSKDDLIRRVQERLIPVKKSYEEFLAKYPSHTDGRLAYGSFLMDTHDEEGAVEQWEKARELDPKNPAAWNNLANFYGHRGPVKKAFAYYERAIELDPKEPVYPWNFATTFYLFRKDAQECYRLNEQQVFDRAMELYRTALKLDPTNLVIATDLAQTYYGIRPTRTNDAIAAWNYALSLAKNPVEEQGIYLHLARVELNSGFWEEARTHLGMVTVSNMQDLKKRLERNWIEKRDKALGVTNSAALFQSAATSKLN